MEANNKVESFVYKWLGLVKFHTPLILAYICKYTLLNQEVHTKPSHYILFTEADFDTTYYKIKST